MTFPEAAIVSVHSAGHALTMLECIDRVDLLKAYHAAYNRSITDEAPPLTGDQCYILSLALDMAVNLMQAAEQVKQERQAAA